MQSTPRVFPANFAAGKTTRALAGLMLFAVALATASLNAQVLTFEGLQNQEEILQFYNGGTGSLGSGPGTNFGISFSPGGLALIDADAGGTGNFANEPTPDTIAFFLSGPALQMNVPAGFTTGFSFFYTSTAAGSVTVYDGLNGTGNVLGVVPLVPTPFLGSYGGDPTGTFDRWDPVGVAFAGTALSVDFAGAADQIGFDNITLGSQEPIIPEPASLALAVLATASLAIARARRR